MNAHLTVQGIGSNVHVDDRSGRLHCRYEVDKLSSSQRLDLNLEKGRMRDELQALRDKSNEMEIKMDRSAHIPAVLPPLKA